MEIVKSEDSPKPLNAIDYAEVAKSYNRIQPLQALRMGQVYNISLFKAALVRRGVTHGTDFKAFNKKGHTYVQRVSEKNMREE